MKAEKSNLRFSAFIRLVGLFDRFYATESRTARQELAKDNVLGDRAETCAVAD